MTNSIHSKKSINTLMKLCKKITLTFNVLIGITLSLLLDQEIYKILNSYLRCAFIYLQSMELNIKILNLLKWYKKSVVQLLIIYLLIKLANIIMNFIKITQVKIIIGKQSCITMIKCLIQTTITISLLNENLN